VEFYPVPLAGGILSAISSIEADTSNDFYRDASNRLRSLINKLEVDGMLDEAAAKKTQEELTEIGKMKRREEWYHSLDTELFIVRV